MAFRVKSISCPLASLPVTRHWYRASLPRKTILVFSTSDRNDGLLSIRRLLIGTFDSSADPRPAQAMSASTERVSHFSIFNWWASGGGGHSEECWAWEAVGWGNLFQLNFKSIHLPDHDLRGTVDGQLSLRRSCSPHRFLDCGKGLR